MVQQRREERLQRPLALLLSRDLAIYGGEDVRDLSLLEEGWEEERKPL